MSIVTIGEIVDGRPCWERMDHEPGDAWEAFQHYRDQGPKRAFKDTSEFVLTARITDFQQRVRERYARMGLPVPPALTLEDVAIRLGTRRQRKSRQGIQKRVSSWAKQFFWYERALWYDRHMDHVRIETAREEAQSMVRRHLSVSGMLQNKAVERLQAMLATELTPKTVLDYIEGGVKLERLTREMVTENTKVQAEVATTEGVDAKEVLRQKLERLGKAQKESELILSQPGQRGVVEALNDMQSQSTN